MEAKDASGTWRRGAGYLLLAVAAAGGMILLRQSLAAHRSLESTVAGPGAPEPGPSRLVVAERTTNGETVRAQQPLPDLAKMEDWAVAGLMEDDPQRVMAAIDHMEDREQALRLAVFCAKVLQGPHFDLLVSWARQQADEKFAAGIYAELIPRWVRQDQAGCVAFGLTLGEGEVAMAAKDLLVWNLSSAQEFKLLENLPDEQRGKLLALRPAHLLAVDPESAVKMIADLADTPVREEALTKLVTKWTGEADVYHIADPAGAVKSVMTIEEPSLRQAGLRTALTGWGKLYPTAAARWLNRLPTGPDRDAALQGMAGALAGTDAAAGRQWAESISDAALRAETLQKLETP